MAQNKRLTKEEIQEDKFIEFVLKFYTFLKGNVRTISITLAVITVGVVGYLVYTQNQEKTHAEAAANFSKATETFKEAETSFLDVSAPSESEDDTDDEANAEKTTFPDAEEKLQLIIEKYPNTAFADKARFTYAKSLYYQGKYPEARTEFEKVIKTHKPENEIYALYAQKAIGNCYEQEGDYAKAIETYETREFQFPKTSQISPEIRQFVITNAKYNQALCHEKLNAVEDAKAAYQEIIDEFQKTLDFGIEQRSQDLIEDAREVLVVIDEPLELTKAEQLEKEELYYEALIAYTDAIRTYKVKKDIGGGLLPDVRKRIRSFEDVATTIIGNVQSARKSQKSGYQSSALNSYDQVVGFDKFGLSRDLYENALLNYERLSIAVKKESNEK